MLTRENTEHQFSQRPIGLSPMETRKRHREEFPCGFRSVHLVSAVCGAGVAEAAVDRLQYWVRFVMHHFISAWESLLGRWRVTWCLLMLISSTPVGTDYSPVQEPDLTIGLWNHILLHSKWVFRTDSKAFFPPLPVAQIQLMLQKCRILFSLSHCKRYKNAP